MTSYPQHITPYPLAWPQGWSRSVQQAPSRYRVAYDQARADLLRQLKLIAASQVVISSNLPLREDGLPFTKASPPPDPGTAVYWTEPSGTVRVIACDKWRTVAENIRAIGATVTYLRGIERAGATEAMDKALNAFLALPGVDGYEDGDWRAVLDFAAHIPITPHDVKSRYFALSKIHHPDRGGSSAKMQRLNHAYSKALAELGTG